MGPDTASVGTGVTRYIPGPPADPVVMAKLEHFAFHNYAGQAGGADALIKGSAYPDRGFWVTEASFGDVWADSITNLLKEGATALLVFKAYDGQDHHHSPGEDLLKGLLQYDFGNGTYSARRRPLSFADPPADRKRIAPSANASHSASARNRKVLAAVWSGLANLRIALRSSVRSDGSSARTHEQPDNSRLTWSQISRCLPAFG